VSLSWSDLRALNGSQETGFEELCSQLARLETPVGAEFIRTGSPDGGVECFSRFEGGAEWGWQAKFFRDPLRDAQLSQLDRSVKAALEAHPGLVRYFVCIPRDRSDGRRKGVTTELDRWESRVATWGAWAKDSGMSVEFVWWGQSELYSRLAAGEQAGRRQFWFGAGAQLSDGWFSEHLDSAIDAAGPRYTPEVHVDVPLVQDFERFGRTESAVMEVRRLAKGIRQQPTRIVRRLLDDEALDAIPELNGVDELVTEVGEMLIESRCPPDDEWPLPAIMSAVEDLLRKLAACDVPLRDAASEHEQNADSEDATRGYRQNPYREVADRVSALQDALWVVLDTLARFERVVNSSLMIVTGDAGVGKTHLLCDVARERLAQGRPTVVLMGQQFTTTDPPWIQARALLDLGDIRTQQFVGALEAAAQAAGARALIMIDAINEGEGHKIWPHHLADLLNRLAASPWIGVVLSVRTPYVDRIIPAEVRNTAYELPHEGFKDNVYAAVERFCEHYGLDFPATPLLRPDFDNPLFLKTLCEGLNHRQLRRIPVGSEGISAVFGRFLDAIDTDLAERLDYDPQAGVVSRALDAITSELAAHNTRWLSRSRAQELVNPLAPTSGFSRSLYRALVVKGLLTELPQAGRDDEGIVCVGYEWFADYLIAKHLLDHYEDADSLMAAFAQAETDSDTAAWELWNAPLVALSILLPERFGVELPQLLKDPDRRPYVMSAFLKGLMWRDPATIKRDCRGLVEEMLAAAQHSDTVAVFDALLTCAIAPGYSLDSGFLDEQLRRLAMPDRDAIWSKYLYSAYSRGGPLNRLLDWSNKNRRRFKELDHDTAEACATVLAWCLTASHRFVRDRATKGLVALLADDVELTREVVRRFVDVDDPYVRERVMAAAYGVAMRSTDAQALTPLADLVYRLIFADGKPPAHILLRDYARGIIERALHLGAEMVADATLYEPPYRSAWPQIPEASELEQFDPLARDRQSEPSGAEWVQGWIYSSVMHMDFALYVIGTNSTPKSRHWLSVPNDEPIWRSDKELAESFRDSLETDLREVFDSLWAHTRPNRRMFEAAQPDTESEAHTNEPPLTVQDSYLSRRLAELPQRPETMFVALLDEEQKAAYEAAQAARGKPEPRLGLGLIQRYVLWRAFDLGWTTERFGELDSLISWTVSHSGIGCGDHKPERIGKKYQWIAYHEILAYISDRFQYWQPYTGAGPQHEYRGAWQLRVRDIDPSSLLTGESPDSRGSGISPRWWRHETEIASAADVSHDEWLRRESDVPDQRQQLCFTDPDGTSWIKLQALDIWQTPVPPGYDRDEVDHREIWLWANGHLIGDSDVEAFISWSATVNFWNRWMPEPPAAYSSQLFFGELGWSFAFDALLGDVAMPQHPEPPEGGRGPVPLQPAAYQYVAESGGYDCSITNRHELLRPNCRLLNAMNLRWSGHAADFVDTDGVLVAFDPSARDAGSSALLMREDALKRFLDETGSALVWAITGEKCAFRSGRLEDSWAGALQLSGAGAYAPDGPTRRLKATLELPNSAKH